MFRWKMPKLCHYWTIQCFLESAAHVVGRLTNDNSLSRGREGHIEWRENQFPKRSVIKEPTNNMASDDITSIIIMAM
jgi:hypothetical protein